MVSGGAVKGHRPDGLREGLPTRLDLARAQGAVPGATVATWV